MAESETKSLTARLVAAYVGKNSLTVVEVADLIQSTYRTLANIAEPSAVAVKLLEPALPVRKSVTPEYIACLECGKRQKALKRHIRTAHGLSPDEYRSKWSLAADYPMVAPNYAQHRSQLAVTFGLGRKKAEAVEAAPVAIKAKPSVVAKAKPAVAAEAKPLVPVEAKPTEALPSEDRPVEEQPLHRYPASRWAKPTG